MFKNPNPSFSLTLKYHPLSKFSYCKWSNIIKCISNCQAIRYGGYGQFFVYSFWILKSQRPLLDLFEVIHIGI